jgi:hypothetical protein
VGPAADGDRNDVAFGGDRRRTHEPSGRPVANAIALVNRLGQRMALAVSETRGAGDLRYYAAIQSYCVLFLLTAFASSRYTRRWDLAIVAGLYVLAKILETLDRPIFELGHIGAATR